jgi:hypothetical protein
LDRVNEHCPVPAEVLAQLYRSDTTKAASLVEDLSETQRIELAMFCYSRVHLRRLAMSIATTCDATKLMRAAGNAGQALAVQCRETDHEIRTARITLAGTRH